MGEKTVKVSDENHSKLMKIKIDKKFRHINDAISLLFRSIKKQGGKNVQKKTDDKS